MLNVISLLWWWLLSRLGWISYRRYLNSRAWQCRRKIVRWWASGRCQLGYTHKGPFDTHHRTYERLGREKLTDLVYLCRNCHLKYHEIKKRF